MDPEVVSRFKAISLSLAFNPLEFDAFNRDIQSEIIVLLEARDDRTALRLAGVKFEANREYYRNAKKAGRL